MSNPQLQDQVQELADQGFSRREIAEKLHRTTNSIDSLCQRTGIRTKGKTGGKSELDQHVDTIRELLKSHHVQSVADQYGVSMSTIYQFAQRKGIKIGRKTLSDSEIDQVKELRSQGLHHYQ